MTALALPIGPGVPALVMAQLHGQGFSLLPRGKGADAAALIAQARAEAPISLPDWVSQIRRIPF